MDRTPLRSFDRSVVGLVELGYLDRRVLLEGEASNLFHEISVARLPFYPPYWSLRQIGNGWTVIVAGAIENHRLCIDGIDYAAMAKLVVTPRFFASEAFRAGGMTLVTALIVTVIGSLLI